MSDKSVPKRRMPVYPLQGMDTRYRPPANSAAVMRDLTWVQRNGWTSAGGFRRIVHDYDDGEGDTGANSFDGSGEILSLHWFAQHNGARQWLIWEEDQGTGFASLVHFNGSTCPETVYLALRDSEGNAWNGSSRVRTAVDSPWPRTQSASWGGRLYLVNGIDEPIVFDGRKTTRAGFDAAPGAPNAFWIRNRWVDASPVKQSPSVTQVGLGMGSPTLYYGCRYRVSYINEREQESPLSPPSVLVIVNNGAYADATARGGIYVQIPKGPPGTVARRLYRTVNVLDEAGDPIAGADEVFFYHGDIQDNDLTNFEDFSPDSALGEAVDDLDFGTWPTPVKMMAVFKNTMFIAGMVENQVRFSQPGFPEVFPADNVFDISDAVGGPITGLYSTKNALLVFRSRAIFLIKGDPVNGFYAEPLTRDLGSNAPRTVRDLPGLGVVFANESGVYLIKGALTNADPTNIVPLSTPISDWFTEINTSAMLNAFAEIYHRDREYWLLIPRLGESKPSRALVFHYEVGGWTYRPSYKATCMIEPNDHRGYLFFGMHDSNYPGICVYSRGWRDKAQGAYSIDPYYEGSPVSFAGKYQSVTMAAAQFVVVAHGTNTLSANFRGNRRMSKAYTTEPTEPLHYPYDINETDASGNTLFPVYGTATWDGAYKWCDHRPVTLRVDLTSRGLPPLHEIQAIVSPGGAQFTLCGYDLDVFTGTATPETMTSNYGGGQGS